MRSVRTAEALQMIDASTPWLSGRSCGEQVQVSGRLTANVHPWLNAQ